MLLRIISGGQTGADQGGLLAARELGIPTGGTAPKGWWTETGSQEQLLRAFGLIECSEHGYDARTKENVVNSDGTLLLGSTAGGGSALTARIADEIRKPLLHLPFHEPTGGEPIEKMSSLFCDWLNLLQVRILNVAGNRESQNPGIQEFTRTFLIAALRSKAL